MKTETKKKTSSISSDSDWNIRKSKAHFLNKKKIIKNFVYLFVKILGWFLIGKAQFQPLS